MNDDKPSKLTGFSGTISTSIATGSIPSGLNWHDKNRKNANTTLSNSQVTSYNEQIQILDVTLKLDTPIPDFMEYFDNNIDNPASHDDYFNQITIPWQYFMSHICEIH